MIPASRQSLNELRVWLQSSPHQWVEVDCPVCQSSSPIMVRLGGLYGFPACLAQCRSCGQLYQNPQLREHGELIRRFYQKVFSGRLFPDRKSWDAESRRGERALDYIAPKQELRCHDLGCGSGGLVALLSKRGYKATGSDLYEPFLEFGRRRGAEVSTSLPKEPLDLLTMINVLHYLPDLQLDLPQILQQVKPAGLFYVETPGVRRWLRGAFCRGNLGRMNSILHLWHFDLAHLEALMSRHGFVLVRGDESVRALFRKVPETSVWHPEPEPLTHYIADTRKYSWLWWSLSFLPEKLRLRLDRQSAPRFR